VVPCSFNPKTISSSAFRSTYEKIKEILRINSTTARRNWEILRAKGWPGS
jgi:hypothetical protein